MDKPKNRIKEVLEERGIKQTWLAKLTLLLVHPYTATLCYYIPL